MIRSSEVRSRLFYVNASGTVRFEGMTFRDGDGEFDSTEVESDQSISRAGGAILNIRGSLILQRCHLAGNHASDGGALASRDATQITDSFFEHNTAPWPRTQNRSRPTFAR